MADGTTLPVHRRRTLFDICSCHCLHCQALSDDKLGIGCLAHEGAIFLKLSQEGIEMERELFMGSCLYFVFIYFEFVPLYLGAGVPQSLALPLNEPELESRCDCYESLVVAVSKGIQPILLPRGKLHVSVSCTALYKVLFHSISGHIYTINAAVQFKSI